VMLAKQARLECDSIAALFPNLTERLCIARTAYHKNELIIVRYSFAEFGFYGACIPSPCNGSSGQVSHQRGDATPDSLAGHHTPLLAGRPLAWGAQPFVAVVPLGVDVDAVIGKEVGNPPTRATLGDVRGLSGGFGTLALRAPAMARSGGIDNLWALQLFSSENGSCASAPLSTQLSFRVIAEVPKAPGCPELVASAYSKQHGASMTVAWASPEDDGGATIFAQDLGVWLAQVSGGAEGEALSVYRGCDVCPPYCIEGLQPSTTYVLRARCANEIGVSPWSKASPPFETPPPEPQDLGKPEVLNVLRTSATVRWSTSEVPIIGYEVLVHPRDGSEKWMVTVDPPLPTSSREGAAGSQTEATIECLQADTTYAFSVRAINQSGAGPLSVLSEAVTTQPDVPGPPGVPELVESTQTSMTLSWSPPVCDGGCPVVRYFVRGAVAGEGVASVVGTFERHTRDASTTLSIKRLSGNTRYVFWVHALNSSGLSVSSPPSKPLLTGPVPPGPPSNLTTGKVEETAVMLQWQEPISNGGSAVMQYHIEVQLRDHPAERLLVSTSSLSATVTGLRGNSRYLARICAENDIGTSSSPAELDFRSGPVPPGPPGLPRIVGELSACTAMLAWNPPTGSGGAEILGYTLQSRPVPHEGEPPQAEHTVATPNSCATLENLEPRRAYRFRVWARSCAGEGAPSEWSPVVRMLPAPPAAPAPPAIVISATMHTLVVAWEDSAVEASVLEWEATASIAGVPTAGGSPQSATRARAVAPPLQLRGLAASTAYELRARVRGCGGWSEWSAASLCATTDQWSTEEIIETLLLKFGSLSNAFRSFDRKCDGFLPLEDFIRGLDSAGLDMLPQEQKLALFSEVDEAQRGCITLREFSKCLSKLSQPVPWRPPVAWSERSPRRSLPCHSPRHSSGRASPREASPCVNEPWPPAQGPLLPPAVTATRGTASHASCASRSAVPAAGVGSMSNACPRRRSLSPPMLRRRPREPGAGVELSRRPLGRT